MAYGSVGQLLAAHSLSEYESKFMEHGWDDVKHLVTLSDGELEQLFKDITMKSGHAARFRKALGNSRAAPPSASTPSVPPIAGFDRLGHDDQMSNTSTRLSTTNTSVTQPRWSHRQWSQRQMGSDASQMSNTSRRASKEAMLPEKINEMMEKNMKCKEDNSNVIVLERQTFMCTPRRPSKDHPAATAQVFAPDSQSLEDRVVFDYTSTAKARQQNAVLGRGFSAEKRARPRWASGMSEENWQEYVSCRTNTHG
jgi:hypothetical protein